MANIQCENDGSLYKPVKKNRINFFTNEPKCASKSDTKLLKEGCNLFSHLFISCQNRQCVLQEFFKHENQSFPASLSNKGKQHTCTQSDLVDVLQANVTLPETKPESDVLIVDGAALVNTVAPRTPNTFEEYARKDTLPKVEYYSTKHKRTDIIFDVYHQSSLKAEARCKRGKAIRKRVTATSKTPSNCESFLRDTTNKTELFHFFADKVAEMTTGNAVIMTKGVNAIITTSDTSVNLEEGAPCSHEEADTRIFVHARHATIEGYKSEMIEANDTDIVVIAISLMPSLAATGLEKMWVAFGKGEHRRLIPIHEPVSAIGPEKRMGCSSSMTSPVVMYHLSMVKGKRQHGRHGMYAMKHQSSSRDSVSAHQRLRNLIYKSWRNLWCMTDQIQLRQ